MNQNQLAFKGGEVSGGLDLKTPMDKQAEEMVGDQVCGISSRQHRFAFRCRQTHLVRSPWVVPGVYPSWMLQAASVVGIDGERALPVDGSGIAPLTPIVTLGMGFASVKLVMICVLHTRVSESQSESINIALQPFQIVIQQPEGSYQGDANRGNGQLKGTLPAGLTDPSTENLSVL